MKLTVLFRQEGIAVPIDGQNAQILQDPNYVWMVERGPASIFLVTKTADKQIEDKHYLFEVAEGQLLFGLTPQITLEGERAILADGLGGSSLLRLEIGKFNTVFLPEHAGEVESLVQQSLARLVRAGKSAQLPEDVAFSPETVCPAYEYLDDSVVRQVYNEQILQALTYNRGVSEQAEKQRLKEKFDYEKRLMANSISKLATIDPEKSPAQHQSRRGDLLFDTCQLVARLQGIDLVSPPPDRLNKVVELEDIARASHIRIREVTLHGAWFREDNGPILAFMKEDERPVALLPESPGKYVIHDLSQGTAIVASKSTAGQLKHFGLILYRPFAPKRVSLGDLLSLGYESCWKRDFATIMLMGVLGGMLGTAIPFASGLVFGSVIPEGERGQLIQIAFFLGASALATMLFQFTRAVAMLRIEGKMEGALQAAVWDRLLSLPVPFFRKFTAGELTMRAMGISQIRKILSGVTINAVLSGVFSIFTFILLFYYDVRLAGVATVLIVAAVTTMGFLGYLQVRYERRVLAASSRIAGLMLQMIGGICKFQVSGAERRAFHRWSQEFGEQLQLSLRKESLSNWLATFNSVFPVLCSMVIFYATTYSTDSLSPGQFIAFNAAFVTLMMSMASLSESLIGANVVIPLYQRAKPILETIPESDETKMAPSPLTGSIEVSHISFRYKEDGPLILNDISFQVEEGEYVALVGTSGCGKSTLFRVLLGFEKPETGKIYYNGQDLAKIDIRSVRKQLGVVLQNGQLMSGSIFTNIVGANLSLTLDDAWEAARMAGLDVDIQELPMGMHTVIGDGMSTFSGGQKQRLMIARAIVNRPRILLFDEATSALDNRTQKIVSTSLDQLQTTRIVIAHRLSTIVHCDRIIVMDKGRIAESGTYDALMREKGIFANLANRQLA